MTKNLLELLTGFKGDGNAFHDLLEEYKLMPIFGNLYAVYMNRKDAMKAVLYVVYAYSRNSPLLLQNEPLHLTKQRACEKVGLSDEMRRELVEFEFTWKTKATKRKLKDKEEVEEIPDEDKVEELVADEYNVDRIITTIRAYLNYQDEPEFSHLLMLLDLYEQASSQAHRMLKRGNEVDFKQKMEIKNYAEELMKDIEKWRDVLAKKNAQQKPLREEVKEVERRVFNTVRPETVV